MVAVPPPVPVCASLGVFIRRGRSHTDPLQALLWVTPLFCSRHPDTHTEAGPVGSSRCDPGRQGALGPITKLEGQGGFERSESSYSHPSEETEPPKGVCGLGIKCPHGPSGLGTHGSSVAGSGSALVGVTREVPDVTGPGDVGGLGSTRGLSSAQSPRPSQQPGHHLRPWPWQPSPHWPHCRPAACRIQVQCTESPAALLPLGFGA